MKIWEGYFGDWIALTPDESRLLRSWVATPLAGYIVEYFNQLYLCDNQIWNLYVANKLYNPCIQLHQLCTKENIECDLVSIRTKTDTWNCKLNSSPPTRLDNLASSAAASLAFFPANSLFSTESKLHYHKQKVTCI